MLDLAGMVFAILGVVALVVYIGVLWWTKRTGKPPK